MRLATRIVVTTLLFAASADAQVDLAQQTAAGEKFGLEVARAFNARDHKALASLLDYHALAQKVAELQGLSGRNAQEFARGMESQGLERIVEGYFLTLDTGNGTAKFMRLTGGRPPRALVRFDLGEHGFNYLEFSLRIDAAGKTRAVDWFQLASGELLSVTLASLNQMFMGNNSGVLERLFGGIKVDEATAARFQRIGELRRAGKFAEIIAEYKQFPEPLANSRILLMARASTAQLGDLQDEYERALEKLAQQHSGDPAAALMLLDYYYTRKDTPKVLEVVTVMEQRVGVDGITCQLRANAYSLSSDLGNALKYAEESIRLEPERLPAHDARASVLVQLGRYQDAVDAYQGMERDFEIKFTRDIFLDDPVFKGLVASRPFRAWLPD